VGVLAGVAGAFVWLIVTALLDPIIAPFQQRMLASMAPNASDLPPEMQSLFDSLSQPGSAPLRFAMGFIAQLFTGAVFSTIGGLVGSSLFSPVAEPPAPPPAQSVS
jgi:predicted permease